MTIDSLRLAILEALAEAALGGHELAPFEAVENGYQAVCTRCGAASWVGTQGLRYSLLEDICSGNKESPDTQITNQ
ncbi:MAG: hypothetical protein IT327_14505 [Anaerolineae bacterium]|nr:hypothetical protein [Anaerolineae bacterium]